ncbi:hypothetical protein SU69_07090 [Thermosipho melanesiensis]|uniref:Uncharacterized protein n=2 Tax=Thermosipho melanesiensis TaxID=46541 RepID=A6LMU6_THEM4|nr:hypothetical protein [Thermosipho melanesiensis]ABR31247.1 hypothetical protein Tmel_1400 [Thermosipho melanesiensis BI429]APT74331.1 hypothetical protein BW47_07415 [Thermosipho melanesiensis]OOC36271.1 hypothetical protein SU68_07160 [Thermosipho melanesiensis]OOC37089.1 hypothetical protein SU69_07090 [Thermosipho melanesiensis]OOC37841.1 hypothetical protein SU70_07100 [Thermosipho melanesiensis]
MTIAFGGDSILYLSIPAFFNAANNYNIFNEYHCTGFSCIPLYFYLKTNSSNMAYIQTKKIYPEIQKIFHFKYGLNLFGMVEQLKTLYKATKSMEGFKSQKLLINFVTKYFPDEKIPEKMKIHAFNIKTFNDEILKGNLREALIKTLSFPIEFSPSENYISGSWVYGIPEADFLIYIDSNINLELKNAIDYMIISTITRTKEIAKKRINSAKYKIVYKSNSKNPFEISTEILKLSQEYLRRNFS